MTAVIETDYVITCLSALTMRSDWFFIVLVTFTDNSLQSADKDQQDMPAVAEKPHDAVVKLDSKCTAASRGPPCNSTALVSTVMLQWYQHYRIWQKL